MDNGWCVPTRQVLLVNGAGKNGSYRMQEIDGSFAVSVERTPWGDVSLTVSRADLQIHLDPAEAVRICREVWALLGQGRQEPGPHAA